MLGCGSGGWHEALTEGAQIQLHTIKVSPG